MARITIQDCLAHVPNRFALVLLSAERTKQLIRGNPSLINDHRNNKEIVTSLREIAAEKVRYVEKEVKEYDPATEAMIRKASASNFGSGDGDAVKAQPVASPEAGSDDGLDDINLDNEFSDESDLDKLFSKLDTAPGLEG